MLSVDTSCGYAIYPEHSPKIRMNIRIMADHRMYEDKTQNRKKDLMADKNRKRDKIFMDLKQLQYFVVCAQTGSFSDAAKNLYSTQPSVSKVIKGLEDTLGMQLFERLPRGIRLTVQGHKIYEYASKIINEVNVLENMASSGMTKWIRISLNPSSWFANQFVDFYNETYEKKYHFQVTTAGVQSVMERVTGLYG